MSNLNQHSGWRRIGIGAAAAGAVVVLGTGAAVAAGAYWSPRQGTISVSPSGLPNHIRGHDLQAGEAPRPDELECVPATIHIGFMQLQCRSLVGRPHATVVGTASFSDGKALEGAVACGDIAPDQAPPQAYPFGCVWLPGATDRSLSTLPQP